MCTTATARPRSFAAGPTCSWPTSTRRACIPGTGALADAGSGEGRGYTINAPVPAGSDQETWVSVLEHVILPAAEAFTPGLVLDLGRL